MTGNHLRFSLVLLLICYLTACLDSFDKKIPINQIYTAHGYKVLNILYENGDCVLRVQLGDQLLAEREISKTPCIIKSVSTDTIVVDRLILSSSHDHFEPDTVFESMESGLVLQLRNQYYSSTMSWGEVNMDSSRVLNDVLLVYHELDVDTIALNDLFFDGELFYTSNFTTFQRYKKPVREATFYRLANSTLFNRYWITKNTFLGP